MGTDSGPSFEELPELLADLSEPGELFAVLRINLHGLEEGVDRAGDSGVPAGGRSFRFHLGYSPTRGAPAASRAHWNGSFSVGLPWGISIFAADSAAGSPRPFGRSPGLASPGARGGGRRVRSARATMNGRQTAIGYPPPRGRRSSGTASRGRAHCDGCFTFENGTRRISAEGAAGLAAEEDVVIPRRPQGGHDRRTC